MTTTATTTDLARGTDPRQRPRLHFTARKGWTNDPHGIVYLDGRYHMFFQHNPQSTAWSERCHWGHAASEDLFVWHELEIALSPEPEEIGCWSGSAVVDELGPVLVYTRIAHDDWGRGAVALARPDEGMSGWRRTPAESVIAGPPGEDAYTAFRDPQVRREGGRWKALLGAGIVGYGGCALQYTSADLQTWEYEGLVARRSDKDHDPVWTGKVWECPQLLQVDDHWVLIVSVWDDDVLHYVVAAVGDLVGHRFEPRRWERFTHGEQLYATTTFTDQRGRACAMSWMRERDTQAPAGSSWCSAMSLPHVLHVIENRVVVTQHPALEKQLPVDQAHDLIGSGSALDLGQVVSTWRLRLDVADAGQGSIAVQSEGSTQTWSVLADFNAGRLVVATGDDELMGMPLSTHGLGPHQLDIVVDADIVEIVWTGGSGLGAARIPLVGPAGITVTTAGCEARNLQISGLEGAIS